MVVKVLSVVSTCQLKHNMFFVVVSRRWACERLLEHEHLLESEKITVNIRFILNLSLVIKKQLDQLRQVKVESSKFIFEAGGINSFTNSIGKITLIGLYGHQTHTLNLFSKASNYC